MKISCGIYDSSTYPLFLKTVSRVYNTFLLIDDTNIRLLISRLVAMRGDKDYYNVRDFANEHIRQTARAKPNNMLECSLDHTRKTIVTSISVNNDSNPITLALECNRINNETVLSLMLPYGFYEHADSIMEIAQRLTTHPIDKEVEENGQRLYMMACMYKLNETAIQEQLRKAQS